MTEARAQETNVCLSISLCVMEYKKFQHQVCCTVKQGSLSIIELGQVIYQGLSLALLMPDFLSCQS